MVGNARKLFQEYPFSVTLASFLILVGAAGLVYVNYVYFEYILKPYHNYPEEVAVKLRRAVYYTSVELKPSEALKYYKQALEVAIGLGMDPFSDEVMGIKIQVAFLLEKAGRVNKAIEVLEHIMQDNLTWLAIAEEREHSKIKRTHILYKTCQVAWKLGDYYVHPTIWDRDRAEERLTWGIEMALKEHQRRLNEKVSEEDEGKWLSAEELGAVMESLAHVYEEKGQHYLATPLFLRALNLYPAHDCHTVVLMNNLASSMAQQSPKAARAAQAFAESQNISERPVGPTVTRESLVESAKTWAQKALEVAASVQPPARTEDCDVGCAVATHNLGEFAEMNKDVALAKRKYQEAVSLARAIGFQEGVEQSSARLRELVKAG